MYPLIRFASTALKARKDPPLDLHETHENSIRIWPWDLDLWNELNNGRTLTLYDLGRIPMAQRNGLIEVLRAQKWGITVAGSSVRYRRRVQGFAKLTMRSRTTCWDDRFFYIEQSMWRKDGECTSHVLIRGGITGPNGLVPTADVVAATGRDLVSPPMPDWIAAWVAAENLRPWPPMQD